ncbi:hypothetical protein [Harryflintia acetispora]|uniref:hypothetical protein n=1 Tax=Harryflintia acetispora TaxID=1849041 RepID=UPI00189885C2|nr:hypothetical protein [Harryflintia acetispora]
MKRLISRRLISLSLLLSLCMGLLLPASAVQEGIPIRVNRPDARIGSFVVWAEECDEGGNPLNNGTRYESTSAPAAGETMDYHIPVTFPDHRQDYLVHVKSVPDERYKGFVTGVEKTMVWTYHYITGLTLDSASLSLRVGEARPLVATVSPEGATAALSSLSASCSVEVSSIEPPTENATCGHTDGFHGGTGSAADPYRIYSTDDFAHMAQHISGCSFLQMVDLDFTGVSVQSNSSPLTNCNYDGGYHVIKNMTMSGVYSVGAIAGEFKTNGTIQRVGIENSSFSSTHYNAGVLVGSSSAGSLTTRECYTLNCTAVANQSAPGGLVGYIGYKYKYLFDRCYALGGTLRAQSSNFEQYPGGIAGNAGDGRPTITDCYVIPYSFSGSNGTASGAIIGSTAYGSSVTFTGRSYYYPANSMAAISSIQSGTTVTGLDLVGALNPMSEFSNPDNFAFSSGDWI